MLPFRSLLKSPGFTLVAVSIVALGVGAVTAMFSTVNALVLRPIPLPEPDRLAFVVETHLERNLQRFNASIPNYYDWRNRSQSWVSLAAIASQNLNLVDGDQPELLRAFGVTDNFLPTFGATLALGRNFLPEEDRPGSARAVILSAGFWQRRFNGARDVLGRTLVLDANVCTIVGVLASDEALPIQFEILVPLAADRAREDRMNHYIQVFGRLKPGVTIEQADAEMKNLAAQIFQELPAEDRGWSTRVIPLDREVVGDNVRRGVYVLLGAVSVLLLIACANLSNLILVRATARTHELAVRTALGASRGRIMGSIFGESLLIAGLGGVAGVLLAWWSIDALRALPLPRAGEISLDPRVLAIACTATLLSGLLAGVGPALSVSRLSPQDALKSRAPRSGRRSRLRDGLVVAQLALSLTLLVAVALLGRSFWRLLQVDPGFNPNGVLTLALRPIAGSRAPFYESAVREISALPGVTHVGTISRPPLTPGNTQNEVYPVGPSLLPPGKPVQASWRLINGDYFGAMQIPLVRGRDFRGLNVADARASMVISASLARALWGEEDPIGRQIQRLGTNFTVIGVVGDVRSQQLDTDAMPAFYMSIHRFTFGWQALMVRTQGDPAALTATIRDVLRRIDSTVPIFQVRTMEAIHAASLRQERLLIGLLGGFAGIALLLAALGTYGVVAFNVQQRTPEIGIRVAIGAQANDVLRMVLGESLRLTAAGLALGLVGAFAVTRLLDTLLYATAPSDLASYSLATAVLAAAAALAALIPARRALRVDPLVALRAE